MRQPGSVFKPFVYTTAINSAYDHGSRVFTPATIFKDEKKVFTYGQESYSPNNFGDSFSNQGIDAPRRSGKEQECDHRRSRDAGEYRKGDEPREQGRHAEGRKGISVDGSRHGRSDAAAGCDGLYDVCESRRPRSADADNTDNRRRRPTVASRKPDRKNVVRPDVAYVMDDMMKDVINRGTAAQAQAWGFKNVEGKTAFAGKTGTSRDGWFAGFTPELVCVVYVGFDNGDDLGMKGADSAMPIWADFMKEALAEHPEWNGDWAMPAGVRKAEIDIRNGSLIREMDSVATTNVMATPTPLQTEAKPDDPAWATEMTSEPKEVDVSNVPAEFRRVELFIAGTVPNHLILETGSPGYDEPPPESEPPEPRSIPSATPTPLNETWQEYASPTPNASNSDGRSNFVSVAICPVSGLRATASCPVRENHSYRRGSEPREFCAIHK